MVQVLIQDDPSQELGPHLHIVSQAFMECQGAVFITIILIKYLFQSLILVPQMKLEIPGNIGMFH